MFKIGDIVVYNPDIKNLPHPDERPWDIGTIVSINNTHIKMITLNSKNILNVIKSNIMHYKKDKKDITKYVYISEDYSDSDSLYW